MIPPGCRIKNLRRSAQDSSAFGIPVSHSRDTSLTDSAIRKSRRTVRRQDQNRRIEWLRMAAFSSFSAGIEPDVSFFFKNSGSIHVQRLVEGTNVFSACRIEAAFGLTLAPGRSARETIGCKVCVVAASSSSLLGPSFDVSSLPSMATSNEPLLSVWALSLSGRGFWNAAST